MTRTASIQAGIGKSFHDRKMHKKAVKYYQLAFTTAQNSGIDRLVADLLNQLDTVYKAMGYSGLFLEYVDSMESNSDNIKDGVEDLEDNGLLPVNIKTFTFAQVGLC